MTRSQLLVVRVGFNEVRAVEPGKTGSRETSRRSATRASMRSGLWSPERPVATVGLSGGATLASMRSGLWSPERPGAGSDVKSEVGELQ